MNESNESKSNRLQNRLDNRDSRKDTRSYMDDFDMKYDKKSYGSPAKNVGDKGHKKAFSYGDGKDNDRKKAHMKKTKHNVDGSHSNNIQK